MKNRNLAGLVILHALVWAGAMILVAFARGRSGGGPDNQPMLWMMVGWFTVNGWLTARAPSCRKKWAKLGGR